MAEGVEGSQGPGIGRQEVGLVGGDRQQATLEDPVYEEVANAGSWGEQSSHEGDGGRG